MRWTALPLAALCVSLLGAQAERKQPPPSKSPPTTQSDVDALRRAVADLQARVQKLESDIAFIRDALTKQPVAPADSDKPNPAAVAAAIRAGRPIVGMTKDEVRQSLSGLVSRTEVVTVHREVIRWGTLADPKHDPQGPLDKVVCTTTFIDGQLAILQIHEPKD